MQSGCVAVFSIEGKCGVERNNRRDELLTTPSVQYSVPLENSPLPSPKTNWNSVPGKAWVSAVAVCQYYGARTPQLQSAASGAQRLLFSPPLSSHMVLPSPLGCPLLLPPFSFLHPSIIQLCMLLHISKAWKTGTWKFIISGRYMFTAVFAEKTDP